MDKCIFCNHKLNYDNMMHYQSAYCVTCKKDNGFNYIEYRYDNNKNNNYSFLMAKYNDKFISIDLLDQTTKIAYFDNRVALIDKIINPGQIKMFIDKFSILE